eukprot:jgi/Tetstr1/439251/TSEL_027693.t1
MDLRLNRARVLVAALVIFAVAGVTAQGKCYWSPDGVQCDDNQPGPAGLSWSFNGYGRGSTNPGYGGNPPPFNGGGELPFGLGNCIRDGEIAGLTAGAKACQRVKAQCGRFSFSQFSTDSFLDALQQVCDSLAQRQCSNSALRAVQNDRDCRNVLAQGTSACSIVQARAVFEQESARYCAPATPGRGGSLQGSFVDPSDDDGKSSEKDRSDDGQSSGEEDRSDDDQSSGEEDSSDEDKSSEEEDRSDESSDEGDGGRLSCTRSARTSAEEAGAVGCRAVLELCAWESWGPFFNSNPPCSSSLQEECKERALEWAERNNQWCAQIMDQGSARCPNSVGARVAFRRAVNQACTPV